MIFYLFENGEQTGPFTGETLRERTVNGLLSSDAQCWCEGWPDWRRCTDVFLPAKLNITASLAPAANDKLLYEIAFHHRKVNVCGLWLISSMFLTGFGQAGTSSAWSALSTCLVLAIMVWAFVNCLRLGNILGGIARLYAFGVLIPCASFVFLVLLSARGHLALRTAGFDTGMLGVRSVDLEALRTSTVRPSHVRGAGQAIRMRWNVFGLCRAAFVFLVGVGLVFVFSYERLQWHRLRNEGKPEMGILTKVTLVTRKNDSSPEYSFEVQYARKFGTFRANKEIFLKHTQPDGTFTHHEISVTRLPDGTGSDELSEMLESTPWTSSWLMLLAGIAVTLCAIVGGYQMLTRAR